MAWQDNKEFIIQYPGVETGNAGIVDMCSCRELSELFATTDEKLTEAYNRDRWIEERAKRDILLVETDFLALQDTSELTEDWKSYRQALRDITTQSDVDNITWPEKPE